MLFGSIIRRNFRTQLIRFAQVDKTNLSKLRKRTGYPISNCKKALEIHENDLKKAFEWLNAQAQKEGWAKAQKLQGRSTTQGLIGIQTDNNAAAMVEVNCETDFVSRNQEFKNLVHTVTSAFHDHIKNMDLADRKLVKTSLMAEQLTTLVWNKDKDKTLSDLVALTIGQIGENMSLKRAVGLVCSSDLNIGHYVHPAIEDGRASIVSGKYGSIIAFEKLASELDETVGKRLPLTDCGRQLCQHVVGMNPSSVGEKSDEPSENIDEETQMIHQEFLIDPTLTVNEFLEQNGIRVVDFVRYECGETSEETF